MSDYQLICSNPTAGISDVTCSTGTLVFSPTGALFDVSTLDPAILFESFAAGFSVFGMAMIIIMSFRFLIIPFFKR